MLDGQVVPDLDFDSLPPKKMSVNVFLDPISFNKCESALEKEIYTEERLNKEQKQIYQYMFDNPNSMVLVQAGPGTGKTFTMLTLAHAWKKPVSVVIYKHDLLRTFRNCARRFTVAKLFMTVWNLYFPVYVGLELQLSGRMSAIQFVNVVVSLLRRAKLPPILGKSIVILDEYTVIPKPLLFILLLLLKYHKIGTVICGDKNQLQNIHNSSHTGQCSSYDIATALVDRTFTLTKNERCGDADYNDLVDYVSRFSSDKRLDKFGYALAAALFHRKFMTESSITDTHLASRHRDLTNTVHMMTINTAAPVSFYMINPSGVHDESRVKGVRQQNGFYLPNVTLDYIRKSAPDKYLPYLPLIVGCRYFVDYYSEYSQATLVKVDAASETVYMRYDNGNLIDVRKQNCNDVMFEKHCRFLLNNGDDEGREGVGNLYNYPIYMANVMSIHMCQGRTIRNDVDIILNDSTYQGFYVSMSRVTTPKQITRVILPDIPSHLVSTVINFPQICSRPDGMLTVEELDSCLGRNYMHYPIRDAELTKHTMYTLGRFFASQDVNERRLIRDQLCRTFTEINPEVLECVPVKQQVTNGYQPGAEHNATMTLILRYKYVVLALSLVDEKDSYVWIHEFMKLDPLLTLLLAVDPQKCDDGGSDERFNLMRRVCGVADNGYQPHEDTLHYIKRHARWKSKTPNDEDRWYIEENKTTNNVLETSRFRCTVYKELSANRPLTIVWLIEQLQRMVVELNRDNSPPSVNPEIPKDKVTTVTTVNQLMTAVAKQNSDSQCSPFKLKGFNRKRRANRANLPVHCKK